MEWTLFSGLLHGRVSSATSGGVGRDHRHGTDRAVQGDVPGATTWAEIGSPSALDASRLGSGGEEEEVAEVVEELVAVGEVEEFVGSHEDRGADGRGDHHAHRRRLVRLSSCAWIDEARNWSTRSWTTLG